MEMISYICVLLIAAMNHISVSFQIHHLKSQGRRYHADHLKACSEFGLLECFSSMSTLYPILLCSHDKLIHFFFFFFYILIVIRCGTESPNGVRGLAGVKKRRMMSCSRVISGVYNDESDSWEMTHSAAAATRHHLLLERPSTTTRNTQLKQQVSVLLHGV